MRDIIFRGKRTDNGEWVQGANILTLNTENPLTVDIYMCASGEAISTTEDDSCINLEKVAGRLYKVNPATVGQYTGLTDKNGTMIFEGDVVEYLYQLKAGGYVPFRADVKAEQESFGSYHTVYGFCARLEYGSIEHSEVIGNIHDNPELLKGGVIDER